MSIAVALPPSGSRRRIRRSIAAVAAALVANVVITLAVDQLLHVLGVYPPWGEPMPDALPNALALAYRLAFGVLAGAMVARLAPSAPMRHAAVLGVVATALATLGAVTTITQYDLGPDWYPIALAVTAYPTVWLGALLHERRRRA